IQNGFQVEVNDRVARRQWDRKVWQGVAQTERPEAHGRPILVAADQGVVIAGWKLRRTRPSAAATQVDLDEMGLSREYLSPLGEVVVAVRSGCFVRRAEQF